MDLTTVHLHCRCNNCGLQDSLGPCDLRVEVLGSKNIKKWACPSMTQTVNTTDSNLHSVVFLAAIDSFTWSLGRGCQIEAQ